MEACRICLSKDDGVNMLTEKLQDRQMFLVFLEFSGLNIPDFPTPMICLKCVEFLKNYLEMKVMVVDNSEYFMQFTVKKEFNDENSMEDSSHILAPDDDDLLPLCDVIIPKVEYINANEEDEQDDEKQSTIDDKLRVKKKKKMQSFPKWCQYCFQTFPNKALLQEHLEEELTSNGGMVCDHCGFRNSNRNNFVTHMKRIHFQHRFVCDRCPNSYTTTADLNQHVRIEHLKARFICPICGKAIKRKSRLDTHIKDVHEKQRPEICLECGKAFARKDQLKVHTIQVHTDLKPYQCSFCEKRFSSAPNKYLHEKTHSSERFKCDQCNYVTNTTANLKRHIVKHENVFNYTCAVCGQQFRSSSALSTHRYTHAGTPFQCPHCPKKYSRPQSLRTHVSSVHDQTKHPCPTCHQEFSSKHCLKKHVKTQHDGIRFFCKCGKYFDRRTRYTAHGMDCHLAATNEPEKKSIYHPDLKRLPPGRPARFQLEEEEAQEVK